jgi:hypothetical protein
MRLITGVLCAAALCVAGCVTQDDPADPSDTAEAATAQDVTAADTPARCSDVTFKVNYYSDASLTTVVGTISCVCFSFEKVTGVQTIWSQTVLQRVCSIE